ncbi:unnamed protein product [Urochloa humidicola]
MAERQPAAAEEAAKAYSPDFTIKDLVYSILLNILIYGIALALFMPAVHYGPQPQLFIRLVGVHGLDPGVPEVRSPTLELAVEVDRVSASKRGPCASGGDDALLRVSYRGIILAWGRVPRFCIDGRNPQGPGASVATLLATAEGSVLREELRNMIRAETRVLGRAEFDVEGSLPGLGHLHCKTYLFQGEPAEPLPPCAWW